MKTLRDVTLVFLVKKSREEITDICLAMKKRGFGVGRWNGVGGKVEEGETIEYAAKRESAEEIGVDVKNLKKVGELSFYFAMNHDWDQLVHVYICENWEGEPTESEEMKPEWFSIKDLPFSNMWPDDIFWLPELLKGNKARAGFTFGDGDLILEKNVTIITQL